MTEQQFQHQIKDAAFQVQCSARAAIWMLHMESFEKCDIETAGLHQPLPEEYFANLLAKPKF